MAGRGSRLRDGKGAKAAGPVWALASLEAWSSRRQLMARGGAGCLPLRPTASLRCDEQDTGRCWDFPEGAELLHLPAVSAAEGPSCGLQGARQGWRESWLEGGRMSVCGHGAWGLLCLGGLAGAKGVQGSAQRRRQRPLHTPSLHFGSVGSEISCHRESPRVGRAG